MAYFNMNIEALGDPEVPYECRRCPDCDALNWAAGRNMYNVGQIETDVIKCWKCGAKFWIDGYTEDIFQDDDATALICEGVPDPSIPTEILTTLLDAATEQYEDLQQGVRSEEDDPILVQTINEIEAALNFVKDLLAEGQLNYQPPEAAYKFHD